MLTVVVKFVVIKLADFASCVLDDLERFVALTRFIIIAAQHSVAHMLTQVDDLLTNTIEYCIACISCIACVACIPA